MAKKGGAKPKVTIKSTPAKFGSKKPANGMHEAKGKGGKNC